MARARNIKPGFFRNEVIAELPMFTRLLFIGLWCIADREGRFEDRPKRIKMELFPADDVDVGEALGELESSGFIVRYESCGNKYAQINNFTKHQVPHHKEVASEIPAPPGFKQITKHAYDVPAATRNNVFARDGGCCLKCGSINDLSIDHIVALSNGGDNSVENLQTLCKGCNSSKGGSTKDYRKSNVDSTLSQRCGKHSASCPTDSLIPDSLIPDSIGVLNDDSGYVSTVGENSSPPSSSVNPIQSRAIELAVMIRKRGGAVNADDPHIQNWANSGVTDAQALTALETAKQQRADKGDISPINSGYLNAILQSQTNPQAKARASPLMSAAQAKAAENKRVADQMFRRGEYEEPTTREIDISGSAVVLDGQAVRTDGGNVRPALDRAVGQS